MIGKKNVRNVRGVGYMTGLKYPEYIDVVRKIQQTHPDARLVGYAKGEAIQISPGGSYLAAEEIIKMAAD